MEWFVAGLLVGAIGAWRMVIWGIAIHCEDCPHCRKLSECKWRR